MKVALVGDHRTTPGGASAADVTFLAAALAARGHDVAVYTMRRQAQAPRWLRTPVGYTVVPVSVGPQPLASDGLIPVLEKFARALDTRWAVERPDVVHAHLYEYGIAAQLAADLHHLPVVQAFHGLEVAICQHECRNSHSVDRTRLESLLAKNATWVTMSCSADVLDVMRAGRSRSRVSVVPHGIDVERFAVDTPNMSRGNGQRILAVARDLSPHKGFDDLIVGLSRLPAAELVIAGGAAKSPPHSDSDAQRLVELAASLGVADRVRMTGAVDRDCIPALMRSADVFACPSWYEPRATVVLEAMASGLPVVATASGAMQDALVHEVTGLLVPPRNSRALTAALKSMLDDRTLRDGMGTAGRIRARARYAWRQVATDAEHAYHRAAVLGKAA